MWLMKALLNPNNTAESLCSPAKLANKNRRRFDIWHIEHKMAVRIDNLFLDGWERENGIGAFCSVNFLTAVEYYE
jgi:hypothetical protein